jgi:purine-nucleoside phosphorylase
VSGLGHECAKKATQTLLENFSIKESHKIINVGICGASKEYTIGDLIEINSVMHNNTLHTLNTREGKTLTCIETPATDNKFAIVDMESYGFYEAVKGMKNAYIFKVVSDHFEPHTVTKERTKNLLFRQIEEIIKRVNR